MDFITYKNAITQLSSKKFDQVFFLLGDDYFLQDQFIKKCESVIFKNDAPVRELLILDDLSQQDIIDRLTQTDFFSSKKLFILRNPQSLKGKVRDELIQFCLYPVPNHFLIIIIDDFYSHSKMIKELQNILTPIEVRTPFENELKNFVHEMFKEKGIDAPPSVIQSVVDTAGDSLYHIANLIDQVCIGLNVLKDLTPEFVLKFNGWDRTFRQTEFFHALGRKDLKNSILIGKEMLSKTELVQLIPTLTALFQEILFLKMDKGTFGKTIGYSPISKGVKNKIPEYAQNYTKAEAERCLLLLHAVDRNIKTTNLVDESLFTNFIFNVFSKTNE